MLEGDFYTMNGDSVNIVSEEGIGGNRFGMCLR